MASPRASYGRVNQRANFTPLCGPGDQRFESGRQDMNSSSPHFLLSTENSVLLTWMKDEESAFCRGTQSVTNIDCEVIISVSDKRRRQSRPKGLLNIYTEIVIMYPKNQVVMKEKQYKKEAHVGPKNTIPSCSKE